MDQADPVGIVLIAALAVAAPLVAAAVGRVARVPLVVFEILLGVLVGPSVLGWLGPSPFSGAIAEFGLALLFFMAGREIDFAAIAGRPIARAGLGWGISLVVAIAVGYLIAPDLEAAVFIGVALTSTALGTIMPMLRDAGELSTPFGRAVTAVGAVGEFGPLIAISLFLSGRSPGISAVVLIGFTAIALLGILAASRGPRTGLHRIVTTTLHTSGQFAVRLVLLAIAALVVLSVILGLDMLLGAFAAGVICRVLLSGVNKPDLELVDAKLEAVAFGFLVPVFFIYTGITFDLEALLADPVALVLLPVFAVLLLLVRGLPSILAAPAGSSRVDRAAIGLFGATGLPIIVAVTGIALDRQAILPGTAAALVGAGMISVLLYPLIGLTLRRRSRGGAPLPPDDEHVPVEA
ncbi:MULTISPECIES: cation:proton antiporter [Herbiconiux]|jgi:Kef-type K+ transport system membrane component KefB|uniref:Kef-type K+ transport system membrane component KefB n=1 Tax=Herbiconiux flava TaxID=881268 RepID=A0A852SK31_9MICO|nr:MULTISPECIES: cation:proton antiporter [Herbiconiux]NQX35779.1 cation:proton antiporter [Herbiconiux sp. VKM Ac-2851]NYD69950.1 Kef-type K+ transport system membrane component KefB [Herbiconiux flava]GLK16699.1 sodium/hydrogen exchanger [Herbiconiux flava]